jgi:hypothetical protein
MVNGLLAARRLETATVTMRNFLKCLFNVAFDVEVDIYCYCTSMSRANSVNNQVRINNGSQALFKL